MSIRHNWFMSVEYTECSATCGNSGIQTQRFGCEKTNENGTSYEVSMDHCDGMEQPNYTRECNRIPCAVTRTYSWMLADFTSCSTSCGSNGFKTGVYHCLMNDTKTYLSERVSDALCASPKPRIRLECNNTPCEQNVYEWKLSDWGGCTATCGPTAVEQLWHVCSRTNSQGSKPVSNRYCENLTPPPKHRQCDGIPPCSEYRWMVSNVSECTSICGYGLANVTYYCEQFLEDDNSLFSQVDEILCKDLTRPLATRECIVNTCSDPYWTYETDNECSASCGDDGIYNTNLTCRRHFVDSNNSSEIIVEEEECEDIPLPIVHSSCNRSPCPVTNYSWNVHSWSPCNGSCGSEGRQLPILVCLDNSGERVEQRYCGPVTDPPLPRVCKVPDCVEKWQPGPWSGVGLNSLFCKGFNVMFSTFKVIRNVYACSRRCDSHFIVLSHRNITPQEHSYDIPPGLIILATGQPVFVLNTLYMPSIR